MVVSNRAPNHKQKQGGKAVPPPPPGPPPRRSSSGQRITVPAASSEQDFGGSFSQIQRRLSRDSMDRVPEIEDDLMLEDEEDDMMENEGLSLEDHVKKLQRELDAATAESGELHDGPPGRRGPPPSERAARPSCQDTTVSDLTTPREDFEYRAAAQAQAQQPPLKPPSSLSQHRAAMASYSSKSGAAGGGGRSAGGFLSLTEALCAFVFVAAASFCGGGYFISSVFGPDGHGVGVGGESGGSAAASSATSGASACSLTPDLIMDSPTYKQLRDKYDAARREVSQLRIAAMEAKENHYMESTIKASEMMRKAEAHTELSERHERTMSATIELNEKLSSIERMYASKIEELERAVKERDESARSSGGASSSSSNSKQPVEMLNPEDDRVRERDAIWQKRDLAMMSKIAHDSHRAVLDEYHGGGPFYIELVLKFPGEPLGPGNRIIMETAPLGMMPHAVHTFLRLISAGLYEGTSFNVASNEEVVIDLDALRDSSEEGAALVEERFRPVTPALTYPEYNDQFPHLEYTVGFAGQGGPSIFINLQDNTERHGPQKGKYDEHGFEVGPEAAFAKVVRGKETVQKIAKRARYGTGSTNKGILLKPIVVAKAFIAHR